MTAGIRGYLLAVAAAGILVSLAAADLVNRRLDGEEDGL